VARQTRSERRARRAAQAESRAAVERAPQRPQPQQVRPAPEPAPSRNGHQRPGRRGTVFIGESWAELKKVDWPGQQQLIQGTAVVLIACVITGAYLFLADEVFRRFVQHVLLGG
jgi:preprotein translocase SecE subunit